MSRMFVDTNVLVHTNDAASPAKRDRATLIWGNLLDSQDTPVVSTQVGRAYGKPKVRNPFVGIT